MKKKGIKIECIKCSYQTKQKNIEGKPIFMFTDKNNGLQINNNNRMGEVISSQILDIIGIVYSGVGIALAFAYPFFFRAHSRVIDYLQWGYFLAMVQSAVVYPFSRQLQIASSFIPLSDAALSEFYCPKGLYVCTMAFAISFMVILVGFLILMRLITIPEKVREKGITFHRVYRGFKGLFKWFFLPLVYESIYFLFMGIQSELIPSVVILAVLLAFVIGQLVLYRFFDEDGNDPFVKWLQFASYLKAALFCLLVVLTIKFTSTAFSYYLALVIVAYAAFHVYAYNYRLFIGRVLYLTGQVIFYFLYSLYVSGSAWLTQGTYLDLYALGVIILLDIVYTIMEGSIVYSEWKKQRSADVLPEQSREEIGEKKNNRYEVGEQFNQLEGSRDQLDAAGGSPKKSKQTRPRPGGK